MEIIGRIIETNTIIKGDMIAWVMDCGKEIAGVVSEITDDGNFIVKTLAFGKVKVSHEQITDIC
jgi:hypothetical protein